MKKRFFFAAAALLACCFMCAPLTYAQEAVTLSKAAVYPNDTLNGGKLAPVMLLSYEGNDYYLTPNQESKQLEKLVEHTVNVQGTVTKDTAGRTVLTITGFKEAFN